MQKHRLERNSVEARNEVNKMEPIVNVAGLHKAYGATVAVDEVNFKVQEGEIFGMVGPNGAGKTTTIECLEGLRKPDIGLVDCDWGGPAT